MSHSFWFNPVTSTESYPGQPPARPPFPAGPSSCPWRAPPPLHSNEPARWPDSWWPRALHIRVTLTLGQAPHSASACPLPPQPTLPLSFSPKNQSYGGGHLSWKPCRAQSHWSAGHLPAGRSFQCGRSPDRPPCLSSSVLSSRVFNQSLTTAPCHALQSTAPL